MFSRLKRLVLAVLFFEITEKSSVPDSIDRRHSVYYGPVHWDAEDELSCICA